MMDDERCRSVLFDLSVLVVPLQRDQQALLHYLNRDGIEILVRTDLDRSGTRHALQRRGILRYVDEILYEDDEVPSEDEALHIRDPRECTYAFIAARCIRADRRPFPLELEAF